MTAAPQTSAAPVEIQLGREATGCSAAAVQLDACLGQIDDLVGRLEPDAYATPLEGIFGGSIGGHVRHCLDHVRVLVEVAEGAGPDAAAPADYDTRARGTDIECNPAAARAHLADLRTRLAAGARGPLDRPVALSVMMSGDGMRVPMRSTLGREIGFVFSHTIHHQAMIGGMARHLGVPVPAGFGRAPSTIAHDHGRAAAEAGDAAGSGSCAR
jgi:uncharacterized damage-inducible protein DinB